MPDTHTSGSPDVHADLHTALAAVARAIAGSLEVRVIWDRVADARHSIVPFDAMGIVCLVQALARSGNNKSKAARLLGLTRAQLRSRIEKHGIAAEGP